MNSIKKLNNGTTVNIITDSKFSEVYLSFKTMFPLSNKTNAIANLLTRMMGDRIENTDTKKLMSQRLDLMYGAKQGSQTYVVGKYQVIDLSVFAIHESFVDEPLLEKQIDFLADSFYHPLLNENTLAEAKHNLLMTFHHIKDQPGHYAMVESFKHAGKGQLMELTSMGLESDLEAITLDDVKAFHKQIVSSAHKQIYAVGDFKALNPDFSRFETGHCSTLDEVLLKTHIEAGQVEEIYDGTQTELVLIYETDITPNHPLYAAYLVYIALLGQLPTSLLFQNIREKHSLAYSIYATRRMFDGVFAIVTGINDENLDKTLSLIQEQIESLKTEVIDLDAAKSYLVLQLEGVQEKQKPWSDHLFRNHILGVDTDIKDIQNEINKVSIEAVLKVANMVETPFVYAYRGQKNETDE